MTANRPMGSFRLFRARTGPIFRAWRLLPWVLVVAVAAIACNDDPWDSERPFVENAIYGMLACENPDTFRGQVIITFSELMDTAATAAVFSITPEMAGSLLWWPDDSVLRFIIDEDLAAGSSFTVNIGATARDPTGNALGAPFERTFAVEDISGLSLAPC